jgi:hypothetical protein
MNIRCDDESQPNASFRAGYRSGHRDARHAAAELASRPAPAGEELTSEQRKLLESHDTDRVASREWQAMLAALALIDQQAAEIERLKAIVERIEQDGRYPKWIHKPSKPT